jgi:hypothetical protein
VVGDAHGEPIDDELACWRVEQAYRASGVNGTVDFLLTWHEGATLFDKQKWGVISSFCNLLVIQIFGRIYEGVARALNNWENHRTQVRKTPSCR